MTFCPQDEPKQCASAELQLGAVRTLPSSTASLFSVPLPPSPPSPPRPARRTSPLTLAAACPRVLQHGNYSLRSVWTDSAPWIVARKRTLTILSPPLLPHTADPPLPGRPLRCLHARRPHRRMAAARLQSVPPDQAARGAACGVLSC